MRDNEKLPGNDNYIEPAPVAIPEPWHPGDGEPTPSNDNQIPQSHLPVVTYPELE
jgi:hypothetical protein